MEVEAKLRAPSAAVLEAIALLRRLGSYQLRLVGTRDLETLYLDTARRDLLRRGIAFRMRRTGRAVELTLKLPGEIAGVVHRRPERTWRRRRMPALPFHPRGRELRERLLPWTKDRPLVPLVGTRIRRTVLVAGRRSGSAALAEIDLDRVRFFLPGSAPEPPQRGGDYEVEIEQLGGDERDLERLVAALSRRYPLRAATASKLARALRWAGIRVDAG